MMANILKLPKKVDVVETRQVKPEAVQPQVIKSCQFCRWYIKREKPEGIGDCRRYPPTTEGRFALTRADDFCGEFATK